MTTRSWYISRQLADLLADMISDLHFRTRRPKHECLNAAVAVALDHEDEIVAMLGGEAR